MIFLPRKHTSLFSLIFSVFRQTNQATFNDLLYSILNHRHTFWLLLGVAFVVISAGIGLRDPWPADEPRFALIAKQMVESGQWLLPMRGPELYAEKPPFFIWAMAVFYALTGSMDFAFLIPSLLASLFTIGLVVDLTQRLWNRATAMVAGTVLLCLIQFTLQSRTAQIDALLCAWVTLGFYGFWRHCLLGPAWGWYALAGVAAGLGVITKGMGILAYFFFIPYWLARSYRAQPLSPTHKLSVWGTQSLTTAMQRAACWCIAPVLTLLTVALWVIPMYLHVEHHATAELLAYRNNILFRQTAVRYLNPWHHVQPFWYFLLQVIPWAWFPASLLLPAMLPFISKKIKQRDSRYLLAASIIVLIIVFFSLSPGKREVYILPATPWVAILTAAFVMENPISKITHCVSQLILGFVSIVGILIVAIPKKILALADVQATELSLFTLQMMAVLITITAVVLIRLPKKIPVWYRFTFLLAAYWLLLGWLAYPTINTLRSSTPMMQQVAGIAIDHEVAILQWKEQYLLSAPQSLRLKLFAYKSPAEQEILQAKAWLLENPLNQPRYLLIPQNLLHHCQVNNQAIDLGNYHRQQWWLVSSC